MNHDSIQLGACLKEARKKRGISQNEMAKLCDVSPSFLNRVENDRCSCSIALLINYAKILNCSLDWILGIAQPNRIIPDLEAFLGDCTFEKQETILKALQLLKTLSD